MNGQSAAAAILENWSPGAAEGVLWTCAIVAAFVALVAFCTLRSRDDPKETREDAIKGRREAAGVLGLFGGLILPAFCATAVWTASERGDALEAACAEFLGDVSAGAVREITSAVQRAVEGGCGAGELQRAANADGASLRLH